MHRTPLWIGLSCLLMGIGCTASSHGPIRGEAEGTVTLDTEPLTAGVIRFIPLDDKSAPAAGAVIVDGSYRFPAGQGPIIGAHRVEIEATDYLGFSMDDEAAMHDYLQKHGGRLPPNPVPRQYNLSSTLTADVEAEAMNQLDFELMTRQK